MFWLRPWSAVATLYRRRPAWKHARTQTGSAVSTRWRPVGRLTRRQRRPRLIPRQQKSSPPSGAGGRAVDCRRPRQPQPAEKTPTSTLIEAKIGPPASDRPAETSDPVIVKAKTTIAAKFKDPASAEFIEMKRAIQKNMVGEPIDTICGRVKGKIASDEEAGDRPFLYFVRDDDGFVVYGPTGSAAETAYRNVSTSLKPQDHD